MGKVMNAGNLRNKICIYEEIVDVNESGFKTSSVQKLGDFRCKAEFLNTREVYRLEKINLKVSIKFTLRNIREKLNEKQKINFNGESYSITYIEEVFDNSNYITIYCNKISGK